MIIDSKEKLVKLIKLRLSTYKSRRPRNVIGHDIGWMLDNIYEDSYMKAEINSFDQLRFVLKKMNEKQKQQAFIFGKWLTCLIDKKIPEQKEYYINRLLTSLNKEELKSILDELKEKTNVSIDIYEMLSEKMEKISNIDITYIHCFALFMYYAFIYPNKEKISSN